MLHQDLTMLVPINRLPRDLEEERVYRELYGDAELERRALSLCENYPGEI
jgi:hypothetical protein